MKENSMIDEYCRTVSEAFFEEQEEMKLGIHPLQVRERIEKFLKMKKFQYGEITFLDWSGKSNTVKVDIDNRPYGIFDYKVNNFIEIFA